MRLLTGPSNFCYSFCWDFDWRFVLLREENDCRRRIEAFQECGHRRVQSNVALVPCITFFAASLLDACPSEPMPLHQSIGLRSWQEATARSCTIVWCLSMFERQVRTSDSGDVPFRKERGSDFKVLVAWNGKSLHRAHLLTL